MPASASSMKTFSARAADVERQWHLIDARDQTLGRLASEIAKVLRGKHKPIYTPHVDTGDHIVVINAAEVRLTGNKEEGKVYHHHTGYIGNLKSATVKQGARPPSRTPADDGRQGHAAEKSARPRPVPQAPGLCRPRPPACGPVAAAA